jgi:superfamily I DNA/RNA helicase
MGARTRAAQDIVANTIAVAAPMSIVIFAIAVTHMTTAGETIMISPEEITFAAADVTVYLAAAGSGKTKALMDEATRLLETLRTDEIAFVTYTRKGVANGIERALQANPRLTADDLVHFKTLHALCFRELGLKHASVITGADIVHFNKGFGATLRLSADSENQSGDDRLLSRYDAIRSGSTKGIFIHGTYDEERYDQLTRAYESFKDTGVVDENGNHIRLVDFHDCLLQFRDRGKPVNVKAAFIDEAQDLTLLQWEVCQIAFSTCEKIFIAGDDFQSLFSYAGGSPRTLVCLAKKYRTVKLETSYRLPAAVYRFTKAITRVIEDKIDKDFRPTRDVEGFVEEITDRDVLVRRIHKDIRENGYSPHRWYLLFRNNCFIEDAAELFERSLVPYHTARGFCLPERELARIKRYYGFRKKGYGSQDAFNEFCAEYHIKDINEEFTESDLIPSERRHIYYSYVQKFGIEKLEDMSRREPFLLLSTTHRVKGGEADYVVVFLDCTRSVAENMQENMDEELRVLYVACTRARIGLYLAASQSTYGMDEVVDIIKEQVAEE